jgi:hypothetical protein
VEIAPVPGVRAVSLQRPPKGVCSPQPQFRIDASERTEDDTYSPDREQSDDISANDISVEQGSVGAQDEEAGPTESMPKRPEGSTISAVA